MKQAEKLTEISLSHAAQTHKIIKARMKEKLKNKHRIEIRRGKQQKKINEEKKK